MEAHSGQVYAGQLWFEQTPSWIRGLAEVLSFFELSETRALLSYEPMFLPTSWAEKPWLGQLEMGWL